MPTAFRKETYSSKLVLKDVVSGSPKVTRPEAGVYSSVTHSELRVKILQLWLFSSVGRAEA